MKLIIISLSPLILLIVFAIAAHASDWDSCADDLDRLRRNGMM